MRIAFPFAVLALFLSCASFPASAHRGDEAPAREAVDPARRGERRGDGLLSFFRALRPQPRDPYVLDAVGRYLEPGERLDCGALELVRYPGATVRYHGAVRVHPAFEERLARFEQVVHDAGVEVYGRAPRRIRHAGTFNCRPVRGRERRISEHALGNAIDVSGFDFGPLPRELRDDAPEDLPRPLKRGFAVTVARHWEGEGTVGSVHRRFLQTVADRLREERIFRGMIGPSHPKHKNHLHLDAGPYRYDWL